MRIKFCDLSKFYKKLDYFVDGDYIVEKKIFGIIFGE